MEDSFEGRLTRLEQREFANRTAITLLVSILAREIGSGPIHEAIMSAGKALSEENDEAIKETQELLVTLAAVANQRYWEE